MLVTDSTQIERYYRALIERATDYVGIFFVGVKTTGVFCISTCRARKPKRENVEFYTDFKDALTAGFRPCKICRPTENAYLAPPPVEQAIALVRVNPKVRISDTQLKQHGISPELVRRWFTKHYGMTFQAFQRMLRVNTALQELKGGKLATVTAFDSGYESLSGFNYTYKKLIGKTPKKSASTNVIVINRFTTPLGPMFVCATNRGICLLEFVDRRMLETEFKDLQRLLNSQIIAGENDHTRQAEYEIGEYFSSQRRSFDVALDMPGSDFQKLVWKVLQTVPYGMTSSYQAQADKMGKKQAVRAVASANGANRIAIIVPCHRIVGKDGSLIGYGGGLARKRWLIEHEKNAVSSASQKHEMKPSSFKK
ncbi:bifunctional transcriptional activator/DNA repair enzyme AdaA [Nitrincola alkalilacustris]|uniref:bifunctional transcriptional activator/DNA repair enzyme AdaA n=1 Tax=Nitrincola alkalilacustris TaxID=1571224 RepID=UPI00124F5762|nr:methylated-DNA--[protein]-cysteine S-methyltransferase [Nitrincola alkalilacustris]